MKPRRCLRRKLKHCILYATAVTVCLTSIPIQMVSAAEISTNTSTVTEAADLADKTDSFTRRAEELLGKTEGSAGTTEGLTGETENSGGTTEGLTSEKGDLARTTEDLTNETEISIDTKTAEELYEIDGGDAEYWKYYDAQGNPVPRKETPSVISEGSTAGNLLKSPYTQKTYTVLAGYEVSHAIDVSRYQPEIDWEAVKADGIDSVIIRCAYRGYGKTGTLAKDSCYATHIEGALKAGLQVGVYIFSQAITQDEAKEEAQMCLDLCKDYLDEMQLPIVMDVEYAGANGTTGRLYDAKLTKAKQTAVCQAFADVIWEAGYQPMVYANASFLNDEMNVKTLTNAGIPIWLAHYTTATDYSASPYMMWQYSEDGAVKGISGKIDMNFIFTKKQNVGSGSNSTGGSDNETQPPETIQLEAPVLQSVIAENYHTLKLSWKKTEGAAGYRVYRKVSGGSWEMQATVTGLTYTDETAATGETYVYTVKAYQKVDGKTVWSSYDKKGISGKTTLAAPILKSTSSQGYKSIKLSWKKTEGADGYRIYRKVSGGKWEKQATVTALTYTDKAAVTGQTYLYTVKAYRKLNGKVVWSSYEKAGISGKAIPSKPSFTLSSTTKGKVKVNWKKISGATGYVVYRKNLKTGKWETVKMIKSGSTVSCTVTGTSQKKVFYTVRAYRTVNGKKVYSKYNTDVGIQVK